MVITNKPTVNVHVQVVVWIPASFSLGKYVGVEWLDQTLVVCLTFLGILELFSKVALQFNFTFLPAAYKIPVLPHVYQHLVWSVFLMLAILIGV